LSAVIGSWKIIEIRSPRTARLPPATRRARSAPSNISAPASMASRAGGSRPRIAWAIIDLPEPDSPTRQTISFSSMSKLTLETAWDRSRTGRQHDGQILDRQSSVMSAKSSD
jgi:hypothetical protein